MRKRNEERKIVVRPTKPFKKAYSKLPEAIKRKCRQKLGFFVDDPSHPSLNLHRINDLWEFYIDRRHRCILRKEGSIYYLIAVGGHEIVDRFRFTLR